MTLMDISPAKLPAVGFRHELSVGNGNAVRDVTMCGVTTRTERECDGRVADPTGAWWKGFLVGPRPSVPTGQPLRSIDLFSSVGGLSLGFAEAARAVERPVRTLLAADIDDEALKVYAHNHQPRQMINGSVRDLVRYRVAGKGSRAEFAIDPVLTSGLEGLVGNTDVILAGPPCQGHSTLNNRSRSDDPRNLLYLTVPAFAAATDAPIVIIENVPNVVNDRYGVVQTSIGLLESLGYSVSADVLEAHRLGWAQTRKRFFLVATKTPAAVGLKEMAATLAHEPLPLSWAISDLNRRALDPDDVMRSVPNFSDENRARIDWLFQNDEYDLPDDIRPDCHKDGHTYPSVYGRMRWDEPAGTITTGFLTPGRGRFIHPKQPRVLTPQEAARVQGFPDWFEFALPGRAMPSRAQVTKWIGDAVPSILGYTAGLSALTSLMRDAD